MKPKITKDEAIVIARGLLREGKLTESALRTARVLQAHVVPVMARAHAEHVNVIHRAWPARVGEHRREWR